MGFVELLKLENRHHGGQNRSVMKRKRNQKNRTIENHEEYNIQRKTVKKLISQPKENTR